MSLFGIGGGRTVGSSWQTRRWMGVTSIARLRRELEEVKRLLQEWDRAYWQATRKLALLKPQLEETLNNNRGVKR